MTDFRGHDVIKDRVRESTDIVRLIGEHVELRKAGANYLGLCPFHAEKTPSFSVNPGRQFFHCFGCGESGDVFSFMMKYHRLSFPEALKELARRAGIDLPERELSARDRQKIRQRERLYGVNAAAAMLLQQTLQHPELGRAGRSYLESRAIPEPFWESYGLGYAPDPDRVDWDYLHRNLSRQGWTSSEIEQAGLAVKRQSGGWYDRFRDRLLFPIWDMGGKVVAFGGRIVGEGKPKYMNSPESPIFDKSRLLFGLWQHREEIRKRRQALVVEGNFDLLALAVHGIGHVVAPLGTSLTRYHVRLLRGYCEQVILFFDGDTAGLKAAMRTVPFFLQEQVEARVALLPEGHDPDSLVRKQGVAGVEKLLDGAVSLPEFVLDTLIRQYGLGLDGKNRIVSELQPMLQNATGRQRQLMISHFSERLGLPPGQLVSSGGPVRMRREGTQSPAQDAAADSLFGNLSARDRQLVDFLLIHPRYLQELLDAGLESVLEDRGVQRFIRLLMGLQEQGRYTPDQIFMALESEADRSYVAGRFVQAPSDMEQENDGQARQLCDELLRWLQMQKHQRDQATLMARIREAQETGDEELLLRLLQEKQKHARKKL